LQLQLPSAEQIQNRLIADRRLTAALAGLFVGAVAALIGLLLALGGPVLAIAAVIGVGVGLYILTNLMAALYVTIAVVALLPFATMPIKIALVPTFIDVALGSFLLVYAFQWMLGKRRGFRFVPAQSLIFVFILFIFFSFVAGLAHSSPTTTILRQFIEMILAISIALVLPDVVRDEETLRRIVLMIIVVGAVEAVIGLVLVLINPQTAERLLLALSRFGYPNSGVIRYRDDDPSLAERAVGTWVDPNAYGGFLMMAASVAGIQVLSSRPVTGRRWIPLFAFLLLSAALWFTRSRGALVALAAVMALVGILRYRWLLIVLALAGGLVLVLPFTQGDIESFVAGVNGQDLSTQMRLGEYKDALILVGRYPIIGVGFTGTPDRDIYLGVSMLYLKIAGATGLIGLTLFLLTVGETFRYGLSRWSKLRASPGLFNLWLGFTAGLFGALVSGIFDHYYFNIEFNASVLLFWLFVGLSLAAAQLVDKPSESKLSIRPGLQRFR
jgi:O-antigen ligase